MRRNLGLLLGFALLLLLAASARAGGWAAVHLDEEPSDIVVDRPWRFGFTVLQHDVTPTNAVEIVITATHQKTGDVVKARAIQEGSVGHFIGELILPQTGDWTWEIEPQPFAATVLETLHAIESPPVFASPTARLVADTCA